MFVIYLYSLGRPYLHPGNPRGIGRRSRQERSCMSSYSHRHSESVDYIRQYLWHMQHIMVSLTTYYVSVAAIMYISSSTYDISWLV